MHHTIGKAPKGTAIKAGDSHNLAAQLACESRRGQNVRRVAAGGNRDEHVSSFEEIPHLSCEDVLVSVIVRDGGHQRDVIGKADRAKAWNANAPAGFRQIICKM